MEPTYEWRVVRRCKTHEDCGFHIESPACSEAEARDHVASMAASGMAFYGIIQRRLVGEWEEVKHEVV